MWIAIKSDSYCFLQPFLLEEHKSKVHSFSYGK